MIKGVQGAFGRIRDAVLPVVFLRRISRELHRANELAEARLALDHPAWYKQWVSAGRKPVAGMSSTTRSPKMTQFDVPSVQEWNDEYLERHPEHEEDEEDE